MQQDLMLFPQQRKQDRKWASVHAWEPHADTSMRRLRPSCGEGQPECLIMLGPVLMPACFLSLSAGL